MENTKWIECGNTLLLMRSTGSGYFQLPEWWPIAQVTLRHVYQGTEQKWYTWDLSLPDGVTIDLGQYETKETAIEEVEQYFKNLDELDTLTDSGATL